MTNLVLLAVLNIPFSLPHIFLVFFSAVLISLLIYVPVCFLSFLLSSTPRFTQSCFWLQLHWVFIETSLVQRSVNPSCVSVRFLLSSLPPRASIAPSLSFEIPSIWLLSSYLCTFRTPPSLYPNTRLIPSPHACLWSVSGSVDAMPGSIQ